MAQAEAEAAERGVALPETALPQAPSSERATMSPHVNPHLPARRAAPSVKKGAPPLTATAQSFEDESAAACGDYRVHLNSAQAAASATRVGASSTAASGSGLGSGEASGTIEAAPAALAAPEQTIEEWIEDLDSDVEELTHEKSSSLPPTLTGPSAAAPSVAVASAAAAPGFHPLAAVPVATLPVAEAATGPVAAAAARPGTASLAATPHAPPLEHASTRLPRPLISTSATCDAGFNAERPATMATTRAFAPPEPMAPFRAINAREPALPLLDAAAGPRPVASDSSRPTGVPPFSLLADKSLVRRGGDLAPVGSPCARSRPGEGLLAGQDDVLRVTARRVPVAVQDDVLEAAMRLAMDEAD